MVRLVSPQPPTIYPLAFHTNTVKQNQLLALKTLAFMRIHLPLTHAFLESTNPLDTRSHKAEYLIYTIRLPIENPT